MFYTFSDPFSFSLFLQSKTFLLSRNQGKIKAWVAVKGNLVLPDLLHPLSDSIPQFSCTAMSPSLVAAYRNRKG